MTQIAATDDALVRLLESCDFPGVTVSSGAARMGPPVSCNG